MFLHYALHKLHKLPHEILNLPHREKMYVYGSIIVKAEDDKKEQDRVRR